MRKILVACLILLSIGGSAFAQEKGVAFESGTLSDAIAKAKKNKKSPKMVFVDCYTSWCGPCKYVANNLFPTEVCGAYFNSTFINIKIDMEKGEGPEVGKKYKVKGYPTFLLLDADGNEINRVMGSSKTAEDFVDKVKNAMKPSNTPNQLLGNYNKNKTADNLFLYVDALYRASKYEEAYNFIDKAFFELPSDQRFTPKMWTYASYRMNDINNPIFRYFESNIVDAETQISAKSLNTSILRGYKIALCKYISKEEALDESKLKEIMEKVASKSDSSLVAKILCSMASCRSKGDIDQIVKQLNTRDLYYLSQDDQSYIERTVLRIKDLTEYQREIVAKYLEEKANILDQDHKNTLKTLEKLKGSVTPSNS